MLSTVSQFIGTEFDYAQYKIPKSYSATYNEVKMMLDDADKEESKDERTDKSVVQSKS